MAEPTGSTPRRSRWRISKRSSRVPFDVLESGRRHGRRSPGQILLITLIVVPALLLVWRVVVLGVLDAHFGSGYDDRRFDALESRFDHRQAAFTEADARMREMLAAHPRAERIGWSQALICVRDAGRADSCKPTTPQDRAVYGALRDVDVITRQSRDEGRTFFRFYGDDPPRYTIVHAPDGADMAAYTEDRGFRSTRPLKPGWTILGPIPDVEREDDRWE